MAKQLKVVFFGDIVGRPGRRGVASIIPKIKEEFRPDLIIANVENSAHGKGVTDSTLADMVKAGVDVFTSGEHIHDKVREDAEVAAIFEKYPTLIKPANYSRDLPGRSELVIETLKGKVLVLNLVGQVFFRFSEFSPWTVLPQILERYEGEKLSAIILDFHAEATSEKVALGRHFDGQLSAVLGTHTHIPTADATILPKGTGYVTDVGMNGPHDSVLGMKSEVSINRFLTGEKLTYEIAETPEIWLNYVMLTIDIETKKTLSIQHEHEIIKL